ncbi:unnamed protein product [Gongylonema pulchrum]|uniref:RDD domain-containing protein n=1 Tax=Gongylonema pulchrum TaxID=637853 RepID=A0A183D156_9BILA|nr:unnamed protein product [Gongylonema pulchrum]
MHGHTGKPDAWVYRPLVGEPMGRFYSVRRLIALVFVFLFVLAWHGTSSNYIYWVLLNALELCLEWFGAAMSKTDYWHRIQDALGPRGEKRLIAFLMLATVIPGVFGVFFFLSRKEIGNIIFDRLLIKTMGSLQRTILNLPGRSLRLSVVGIHFLVLGYCFNHVCLELDEYFSTKKPMKHEAKKKLS